MLQLFDEADRVGNQHARPGLQLARCGRSCPGARTAGPPHHLAAAERPPQGRVARIGVAGQQRPGGHRGRSGAGRCHAPRPRTGASTPPEGRVSCGGRRLAFTGATGLLPAATCRRWCANSQPQRTRPFGIIWAADRLAMISGSSTVGFTALIRPAPPPANSPVLLIRTRWRSALQPAASDFFIPTCLLDYTEP